MRQHRIWPTFKDPRRYRGYVVPTVGVVESPARPAWIERYSHDEPLAGDEVQPQVRWWTRLLRWLGIG